MVPLYSISRVRCSPASNFKALTSSFCCIGVVDIEPVSTTFLFSMSVLSKHTSTPLIYSLNPRFLSYSKRQASKLSTADGQPLCSQRKPIAAESSCSKKLNATIATHKTWITSNTKELPHISENFQTTRQSCSTSALSIQTHTLSSGSHISHCQYLKET